VIRDWRLFDAHGSTLIVTATEEEAKYFNEQCSQIQMAQSAIDWEHKKTLDGRRQARLERIAADFVKGLRVDAKPYPLDPAPTGPLPTVTIGDNKLFTGHRVRFTQGSFAYGILANDMATVIDVNLGRGTYEVECDRTKQKKTIAIDKSPSMRAGWADFFKYLLVGPQYYRAMKYEHLMLVNPHMFEESHQPVDRTGRVNTPDNSPDFFRWKPTQPETPTIYSNLNQPAFSGLSAYEITKTVSRVV
jgi:hypothetical protein